MKRGIQRDLILILALLGVFVLATGSSFAVMYLAVGPPPADPAAKEAYAATLKALLTWSFLIGVGVVSFVYLCRLIWFRLKPKPAAAAGGHAPVEDAGDAYLPAWLGWVILLAVVAVAAMVLIFAAFFSE